MADPPLKFNGQVKPEYLARHWEELVSVAGSLKRGYGTASLFIRKLQAYSRLPPAALAHLVYMQKVTIQLWAEGYPVQDEDLAPLSPDRFEHLNRLVKYTVA